jgi:hypothetical protein
MTRTGWLGMFVLGLMLLGPTTGQAGPELGSFVWQVAPFCNVVTLTVVQDGPGFSLSGFDDNCGGAHSAAYGAASFNPDGTVSLGLTILAAGGAAEQFSVVLTAASGFSGTWQDASGNTGDFLINPLLPAAGTLRPAPAVNGALLLAGSVTNGALAAGAVTGDKLPAAVDGSRVLDTIDPVALELRLGGERALRLEPATSGSFGNAPNVIGGFSGNGVAPGVVGATIAGGGSSQGCPPCPNTVTSDFGTVGGGRTNTAGGVEATVGGGLANTASGLQATVSGGAANAASGPNATVGGGISNTASQTNATVGGGEGNTATTGATVGGGLANTAGGAQATVGGGVGNTASGIDATVGGGQLNTASATFTTVPGGSRASASIFGQMAYASGQFAAIGDAQTSLYVLRNTTTDATPTDLALNGANAPLTLTPGRTMTYDILIAARSTGGQSAGYHMLGVIENNGGTTTQLAGFTKSVLGEDVAAWDANVTADNGNDALVITVTGAAATTIRWVAVVRTVEVSQ